MRPLRLRPHHFLCMLTYAGKGYTPRFVRGYDRVVMDMKRGRFVELVVGPDDICAGLSGSRKRAHCYSKDVQTRDAQTLQDFRSKRLTLTPSAPITAARLRRLRKAYTKGTVRSACTGCSWKRLCDSLVVQDFAGCKLTGAQR
ncbi:MAG: DUF1284 domain-containing protein [Terricaulis sp.]